MTESTAIRVSRTPCRELQGIEAEDLHFKNFSSEALARPRSSSNSGNAPPGPTGNSPKRRSNHARRKSQSSNHRPLRHMRSVESFSQPNPPKSPRAAKTGATPITPPPRKSSRAARTSRHDPAIRYVDSPTAATSEYPLTAGGFRIAEPLSHDMLSRQTSSSGSSTSNDSIDLPHAVTTPDDTARHLSPAIFGGPLVELDCVPEEEEAHSSKRKTKRSSRSSSAPRSRRSLPGMKTGSDRHSSQGSLRSVAETQERNSPPRKLTPSKGADMPQRLMTDNRESWGLRFADRGWEDDIDFCYEHAAEADCDFDWDRISNDRSMSTAIVQADIFTAPSRIEAERHLEAARGLACKPKHKSKHSPKPLKPSGLYPGCLNAPESGAHSAQLVSRNDDEITTSGHCHTSTISHETSFNETEGFTLSPSLLIPADYGDIYEGIIDEKAASPYPLYDRTIEPPESGRESFRSSGTTLSKSSQESIALRHKASNSGGSLPELVHSRNYREEFNNVAEQLAEQIASLKTTEMAPEVPVSHSPKLRRNRGLVKDVAHQAMLRRAASSNALNEKAIPHLTPRRPEITRANSDNPLRAEQPSSPAVDSIYEDRRHAESAASIASLRARNRALYSLFPTSPPTSPRSPVSPI